MVSRGMPWVRLYNEFIDNIKVGKLSKSEQILYVKLIILAGDCDAEGALVAGSTPMTPTDISWRLRDGDVERDLPALRAAGMVECHDGVLSVHNFAERQGRPQSERRAKWRERQQRRRGNGQASKGEDTGKDGHTDLSHAADVAGGTEAGRAAENADAVKEADRDGDRDHGHDRGLTGAVVVGVVPSASDDALDEGAPSEGVTREGKSATKAVTRDDTGSTEDITRESAHDAASVTRDTPGTHGNVTPLEESRGEKSRPEKRRAEPQQRARTRASPAAAAAAAACQDNVGLLTPVVAEKVRSASVACADGSSCEVGGTSSEHNVGSWRSMGTVLDRWAQEIGQNGRGPPSPCASGSRRDSDGDTPIPASRCETT